jgi:hypothetical protein
MRDVGHWALTVAASALFLSVLPVTGQESVDKSITATIKVGPEVVVMADGPGQGIQADPSAAFSGDAYLVTWREGWHGEGGTSRIYAARIDTDGRILDHKGIVVAADATGVQERPRVAAGKRCFLAVWQELTGGKQYDVRAARISPEGKVLDARPLAIAAGPESQIAWDGRSYLVVAVPMAARLDASAQLLDKRAPTTLMSAINTANLTWSLAGGGTGGWLLVSDRAQPDYWGWGGPGATRCRLIGTDGKVDSSMPPELSAGIKEKQPGWLDMGKDKKEGAPWPSGASAVVWDGTQYVAVWQRYHITKTVMFANCDLIASRVRGWKPQDDAGVPVADSTVDERRPALASAGNGKLLCVYERLANDGTARICARVLVSP